MKLERLKYLDKQTLIKLYLMKSERLDILEKRLNNFEKLGKLAIDNKDYYIWREEVK